MLLAVMNRRIVMAGMFAGVAGAVRPLSVRAQSGPLTLGIAVIPSEIAAGAYYARDLGYFKSVGVDAQITSLQNGSAITAAVVSGAMDVGFSNTLSLIIAHDKGLPVTVLLGTDVYRASDPTNGILAVLKSSPVHTAKDLTGKTVGVSSLSNTPFYALRNWIDRSGGDSKTVQYVEIPIPQMADAVLAGRVEAGTMDAANANAERSRAELRRIASTYDSIAQRFMAGAWFSSSAWAQKNSEAAPRFVTAMRKASLWANAHPADAVKIFMKYSRFTESDLLAAPRPFFATDSAPNILQPVIDVAAQYGAIKAPFPARDLLSPYTK
jgi:NitT/TauT family transport system substrate-binding protein